MTTTTDDADDCFQTPRGVERGRGRLRGRSARVGRAFASETRAGRTGRTGRGPRARRNGASAREADRLRGSSRRARREHASSRKQQRGRSCRHTRVFSISGRVGTVPGKNFFLVPLCRVTGENRRSISGSRSTLDEIEKRSETREKREARRNHVFLASSRDASRTVARALLRAHARTSPAFRLARWE